jgi:hypothetical protein
MTTIPVDQIGRITNGADKGQYVLVRSDKPRTGGFLIFQSSVPNMLSASEVFDSWLERGMAATDSSSLT